MQTKLQQNQLLNLKITPIASLPLEIISKIEEKIIKYKVNGTDHEIDYTNDFEHKLIELPNKMYSLLYPFQKVGIDFGIKKLGRVLIADEMGVGKTIQAIGIAAIFKEDWPVLIVTPSSLKFQWRDEITNWLSEDNVTKKDVQIIKNSKEKLKDNIKFYITSYDLCFRICDKLLDKNFKFAIADEAHYIKNIEAKRTLVLLPIFQKCKRLILLTGTPILSKPFEIFPILKCLRPDIFHNFKSFGVRYCDPKPGKICFKLIF